MFATIPATLTRWRWRLRHHWRRWLLAVAFARDNLTRDQALDLLYHAEEAAGVWPLATFDAEGVLQTARERWGDNPALERLAHDAASRVASKWSGDDGHLAGAAEDWALDLLAEFAAQEGIELRELA